MSGIYWLASYPKSGNTWLRALLTNYRSDRDEPAAIDELDGGWTASLRETFDDWTGIESIDLTRDQVEHYRPWVYEMLAADCSGPQFLKIHDAYTYNADRRPIFSKQATAGVIYLIRNPLDIAVSYSHHRNEVVDKTISIMNRNDAMVAGSDKPGDQLPQKLLSWSGHVSSWVNEPGLRIHVVRYEDMVRRPAAVFTRIVRFSELELDPGAVEKAVEFSRFERLQSQEAAFGFSEKQPTSACFFRKGRVGSWRECLAEAQVRRLVADHHTVMRRFGYLSPSGEILC